MAITETKTISILGSTGSIGRQAIEVCEKLGFPVAALTARHQTALMEEQIRRVRPRLAVLTEEAAAKDLRARVRDLPVTVLSGLDGLLEAAALTEADIILNAVVGMVGLRPTLHAIEAGKTLALANKETLVAGGDLVMSAAAEAGVSILPVDSEHSAIFQCLQGAPPGRQINRLILTASGGPFFGKKREDLTDVTREEALHHPNWSMGPKITVDSATMMNKGLEIIEAVHLFHVRPDQVDVVVHRESVIHSMVEYADHSVIAQLGRPDMRIPIQYALTYPDRTVSPVPALDFAELGKLTFFAPDTNTFTCMAACQYAIGVGGLTPAAVNGANEEAVALFLEGKISFLRIGELVWEAARRQSGAALSGNVTLEDIFAADASARAFVRTSAEIE